MRLRFRDFDGYEFDLFWTNRPQTNEQFSQELRLESQWSDSFKSIFGLYLWEREYEINQQTYFTPLFFGLPPGPAFEVANGFDQIQETESWSVFGQIDWAITDAMTLSIGGRYLDEERHLRRDRRGSSERENLRSDDCAWHRALR